MTEKHTAHSVVDWTGYLYHEEVDALKELAQSLPTGAHIVNIGAGNGTSGLAFMEARADLRVTTIDIQLESSPYGCLAGEEAVFRSAGFWGDPRHQQIHGDSKEVGKGWDQGPVDMVFVDGGHQYHEAKGDLDIWRTLITPGGLLVVHDYEKGLDNKHWPGVDRAVNDYIEEHPEDEEVLRVRTTIAQRVAGEPAKPERPQPAQQPARQQSKRGRR